MKNLLIRGARVIDPSKGEDAKRDVFIRNGKICYAPFPKMTDEFEEINADGLVMAPGFIDMHVHLRDPGQTEKEDIISGGEAAAAGGFTAVACMPNTIPTCDTPEIINYIIDKAKRAKVRVYPIAAITKNLKSSELTDFHVMKSAGAVGVSDDGRPVENSRLLLEALRLAKDENLILTYHAEKLQITNGGIMHEGEISRRINVPGVDRASEDGATAEVITLAEDSGARVHICHVSTAGAISLIREAKHRGVAVTCETGPHYFTMTHERLLECDANYRMAPPLREESDRLAVLAGIADGTIDCIATDHAPHTEKQKEEFKSAPNGIIGLETSLALCITYLVKKSVISLPILMKMMSLSPARILSVSGGTLEQGSDADFVLFDPNEEWTVDKNLFYSKSRNTPFNGMKLFGRVKYTFLKGILTYKD